MKLELDSNPRKFTLGRHNQIEISDFGKIRLDADEMVTFKKDSGREYDLTAKSWGFYATPSVNSRLKNEGFKTALVRNSQGRYYVMLVEPEKMDDFNSYLEIEDNEVVEWLDER